MEAIAVLLISYCKLNHLRGLFLVQDNYFIFVWHNWLNHGLHNQNCSVLLIILIKLTAALDDCETQIVGSVCLQTTTDHIMSDASRTIITNHYHGMAY